MSRKKVLLIRETKQSHPTGISLLKQAASKVADVQTATLGGKKKPNYGKKTTKDKLATIMEAVRERNYEAVFILTDKHRVLFDQYPELELKNGIKRHEVPAYVKRFEGRARRDNKFEYVTSEERLEEIYQYALQAGEFSFDFETTGLEVHYGDYTTLLAVSIQPGYSYIIPNAGHFAEVRKLWQSRLRKARMEYKELRGKMDKKDSVSQRMQKEADELDSNIKEYEGYAEQHVAGLPKKVIFEWLGKIAADDRIEKIAHNLDFELQVMQVEGLSEFKGIWHDTMIQAHLLDENKPQGLKSLVGRLVPEYAGYDKELDKFNKRFGEIPLETLSTYASLDSDLTYRIHIHQTRELLADRGHQLYYHYRNLDMPARMELSRITYDGLKIDRSHLKKMIEEGTEDLKQLERKIKAIPEVRRFEKWKQDAVMKEKIEEYTSKREKHKPGSHYYEHWTEKINSVKAKEDEDAGYTFDPGNTNHVTDILFSENGFGVTPKFDKDGEPNFNSDKYTLYEVDSEFSHMVIHYRTIYKMLGTYCKGLLKLTDENGYIHGNLKSNGTVTGRLSSSKPNLQNMPSRMLFEAELPLKYVHGIKKAFVTPGPEWVFSQADYSQAELRMVANFSGDPTMINTYKTGKDIHYSTAAAMKGVSYDDIVEDPEGKTWRQKAKSANFGIVYGISATGYMEYVFKNTGVRISKTEAEDTIYRFFERYPYLKLWHKEYEDKAMKNGYVRTIFGRKRHLHQLILHNEYGAKRIAINAPIQGSSGEFLLFSLAVMGKILNRDEARIVNTIHDSIFHYLRRDKFAINLRLIKKICEDPPLSTFFQMPEYPVKMEIDFEFSDESWKDMEEYPDLKKAEKEFNKKVA